MKNPYPLSTWSLLLAILITLFATSSPAHEVKCDNMDGIKLARCERHQKMAAKCGPLKGGEHYACDREYLIANPLDCKKMSGKEGAQCEAEAKSFKTCTPQAGKEFLVCVRKEIDAMPM